MTVVSTEWIQPWRFPYSRFMNSHLILYQTSSSDSTALILGLYPHWHSRWTTTQSQYTKNIHLFRFSWIWIKIRIRDPNNYGLIHSNSLMGCCTHYSREISCSMRKVCYLICPFWYFSKIYSPCKASLNHWFSVSMRIYIVVLPLHR